MSYTVNNAVNQVITRLNEEGDTPAFELPDGTTTTPTITSANQIVTFLKEGLDDLVRRGVLKLWGTATASVSSGNRVVGYSTLTVTPANHTIYRPVQATWESTLLERCLPKWLDLGFRGLPAASNATPTHWAEDVGALLLAPKPSSTGTLLVEGFLFHPSIAAGDTFQTTVPDDLIPAVIAYACYMASVKNLDNAGLAAFAPVAKAEYEKYVTNRR